jgi:uncharacterized protein
MYFNVSQLLREPSGAFRTYSLENSEVMTFDGEVVSVSGTAKLLKIDRGIWVSARLGARMTCQCSRCLGEGMQTVHIEVEEEYLPQIDPATGRRMYYTEEDYDNDFLIDLDHVLDMTEAVRQYISINTPMRPLCKPDCQGICMYCGVNRNEAECMCAEAPTDPRWRALLEIASVSQRRN